MSKRAKLAAGGKQAPLAIVLDIEGTVAPISFVTETLFPYARERVKDHLNSTYDTEETQADIALLREQVCWICSTSQNHCVLLLHEVRIGGAQTSSELLKDIGEGCEG